MGDSVRKHQLELAAHQVPVLAACMPMLLDALCGIVQFPDLLRDVPLAHPAGIQRQNLLLHAVCIPAVLADDLRLKRSGPGAP